MRYLCQPCDHRWYQHRHPNPRMRFVGQVMMATGFLQAAVGLGLILR